MTVTVPQVCRSQRRHPNDKLRHFAGSGLGKFAPQMAVSQPYREEAPGPSSIINGEAVCHS